MIELGRNDGIFDGSPVGDCDGVLLGLSGGKVLGKLGLDELPPPKPSTANSPLLAVAFAEKVVIPIIALDAAAPLSATTVAALTAIPLATGLVNATTGGDFSVAAIPTAVAPTTTHRFASIR